MSTTSASLLEVDLEVERRQVTVQAGFGLEAGERLAIFGTSGAGKTTILESIAGLTHLSRGNVRIDGKLVAGKAKGRGGPRASPQAGRPRAPAHDAVPAPHSRAERGLRDPPLPRPRPCRGAARTPRARARSPGRVAPLCPVANASAWRSGGRLRARSACCCSTSRSRLSTWRHVRRYACSTIETSARAHDAAGILVTHDLTEAQAFSDQLGIIDERQAAATGGAHEVVLSPPQPPRGRARRLRRLRPGDPRQPSGGYAIHPDRVVLGAVPERGVVLTGTVLSTRPFGPRYECTVAERSGEQFTIHLDQPPRVGAECTLTALDPPVVAP